jgi:hypothetical protein
MNIWLTGVFKKLYPLILVIVAIAVTLSGCKKSAKPSPKLSSEMPYSPTRAVTPLETTYPPPEAEALLESKAEEIPYPPPLNSTPLPETPEWVLALTPTPTPQMQLTAEILRLMGTAATLREGDIWLLQPDQDPEALTDFGDVAVLFGWNKDGSLLLFGRGRVEQPEFSSDTTDLWIFDVHTRQARQFTTSAMVNSVAWSPRDDVIAYSENGDLLTVADLKGTKLHQLEHVLLGFNWSPDGSSIAVRYYTPDMVDSDGLKFTTLAVWHLPDEKLQVLSDAKTEVHSYPIWSLDGQKILFRRNFYEADQQAMSGLYVVDVVSGQMKPIGDRISVWNLDRSPRADLVAYQAGENLYVTDFEGQSKIVAPGKSFTWLLDGKTIIYRGMDDSIQMIVLDIQVADAASGGQCDSVSLYIQPEYFIMPEGQ